MLRVHTATRSNMKHFFNKPVIIFSVMVFLLVLGSQVMKDYFTVGGAFQERVLSRFSSDFHRVDEKKSYEDALSRPDQFLAFAAYTAVSAGRYRVIFTVDSQTEKTGGVYLFQVVSDKGRRIEVEETHRLQNLPAEVALEFDLFAHREIEPRIVYRSGNALVELKGAHVARLHYRPPYAPMLFNSFVLTLLLILLFMSLRDAWAGGKRWKGYLSLFLFSLGFLLILRNSWISEDAFISLRHVDNLLAGHGPVFNPGERVEGYTHTVWFFILVFFRAIGFSPNATLLLPGLVFSLLALYIIFFRLRYPGQEDGHSLHFSAAVLIAVSPFVDFGTSGLETALSYFLLSLFAMAVAKDFLHRRPMVMGLILALMVLNRPDFGVFFLIFLLIYLVRLMSKKDGLGAVLRFLLFPAILGGGYQLFRMGYFASIFPNPFFAKSGAGAYFRQGIVYLKDFLYGNLSVLIILLAFLALLWAWKTRRQQFSPRLMIIACGLVYAFFVIRGGGDFMHGRFLLPGIVLLALAGSGAFDRIFDSSRWTRITAIALSVLLSIASLLVVPLQKRGPDRYVIRQGISDERYFYYGNKRADIRTLFADNYIMMWKTMGQNWNAFSSTYSGSVVFAHANIGFMGYYAGPKVRLIDLLGLTDPVIARVKMPERGRPGHEKKAPLGYLLHQRPTVCSTPFPVWNEIAETPFGVLWDLSYDMLRHMSPYVSPDFKARIDRRIVRYVSELAVERQADEADFMFFLHKIWRPCAGGEDRKHFDAFYRKDVVELNSPAFRWLQRHQKQLVALQTCIREQMSWARFWRNVAFALTQSYGLRF